LASSVGALPFPMVEGCAWEQSEVLGVWFGEGFCVMAKPRFAAIAQGIAIS